MLEQEMQALLARHQMAELGGDATVRRYATGATVFSEGDRADRVLMVASGRVRICHNTDDGREVMLAVAGPGEVIGEMSVIDGEPRSASAVAMEPVQALVIPAARFVSHLEARPQLTLSLLRAMVRRLRATSARQVELVARDTVGRVALRLVEAAQQGRPVAGGIGVSVSHQELADWVGASREGVTKALAALRSAGLVKTGRREVVVTDLEGLRRRVD
ncbi:MAG: Crp/Fnr family transcriptional regulator [Candidatus Dormibacteria bacterium]